MLSGAQTARMFLVIGVILSVIGGVINVGIGLLDSVGVVTPLIWVTDTYFPASNRYFMNVVLPIIFGGSGCICSLSALGFSRWITSNTELARLPLVILGVAASVGSWFVGGALIVVAGIQTHRHWMVVREADIIRRCKHCGATVATEDRYCAVCGVRI